MKNFLKSISNLSNKFIYQCHARKSFPTCYVLANSRYFSSGTVLKKDNLDFQEPHVPKSSIEVEDILNQEVESPQDSKLLKIAILGVPNSGKSTLINQLVQWKVCSVSPKVHTTMCNARALTNEDNVQLVFLDTPGIVTMEEVQKHKLKNTLFTDPEASLAAADCIGVLHDASNIYTRHCIHPGILRLLSLYPTIPSILILNKVDLLKKKKELLNIVEKLTSNTLSGQEIKPTSKPIRMRDSELASKLLSENNKEESSKEKKVYEIESSYNVLKSDGQHADIFKDDPIDLEFSPDDVYSGRIKLTENQVSHFIKGKKSWQRFREVFMTSALDGTGIEPLRSYFLKSAVPSEWLFSDDVLTDQAPQDLALLTVREKCLENLTRNVPYELKFKLLYWDLSEADVLNIIVSISSKKPNLYKYLIGASGSKLKQIAMEAEQELRNIFRTEVRLRVNVESKGIISKKKNINK